MSRNTTGEPRPDPLAAYRGGLTCDCGGRGGIVEAEAMGPGWWLVTAYIAHVPGCGWPDEFTHLLDVAQADAGNLSLPPLPSRHQQCTATARSTGRRCRLPAWLGGLCRAHQPRGRL